MFTDSICIAGEQVLSVHLSQQLGAFCKYVEKTSIKRNDLMKKMTEAKSNKQAAIDNYFK